MIIIGAGMSGLICSIMNPNSTIFEANASLPKNHHAILRLKSDEISRLTGIEMTKVYVHKAVWYEGKECDISIALSHMYSRKVTGLTTARSIMNLDPGERFIPPVNFVDQLAERAGEIRFDEKITHIDKNHISFESGRGTFREDIPVVSTIPMPALSNIAGDPILEPFVPTPIVVNKFKIPRCKSYCTIYYPDERMAPYRASLDCDTLIIESIEPPSLISLKAVFKSFGLKYEDSTWLLKDHIQPIGKIPAITNSRREKFIVNQTIKNNVFSLGRFATWRPKLMLDDIINDIFQIRRLISKGQYEINKYEQGE